MHKNIIRQILEDPSAFMYAIRAREIEAEACLQQFLASDEDGGAPLPKIGDNSNGLFAQASVSILYECPCYRK